MSSVLALFVAAAAAASAPVPADTVAWVRANVVDIGSPESAPEPREAQAISSIVKGARIIALGEPQHGHAEPLQYRNRWVRHLVEHEGLTAVALESGIADTKAANDFVLGGPGTADAAAAKLSWRFNELADNVTLIDWLRRWNDTHPRAKVRIYGIDVSGGDSKAGFGRARSTLDWLATYLLETAPASSASLRAQLERWAPSFSPAGYAALDEEQRVAVGRLPGAIMAWLADHRSELIRSRGADAYEWALRMGHDTSDLIRILPIYPVDANTISPGLIEATAIRERAMVAHTLWALEREGSRGKLLLFQSNSHVAATNLIPINRPPFGDFEPTGAGLRQALGTRYRVVLTTSSLGKGADDETIGTVDRALAAAGVAPALLDIRNAPQWWDQRQTLAHGGTRVNAAVPKQAFDALIYVEKLTPATFLKRDQSSSP